jgi:hypothetical protein
MYRPLLFALLCCCSLAGAAEMTWKPGLQGRVPCVDDPSFTLDVLLPGSYEAEPERIYPALFLFGPGGDPGAKFLQEWADSRGFIVISVNGSRDGPERVVYRAQDLALKSVEEWGLRAHHCLRFAAGVGGGGWAAVTLAKRFPNQIAGVQLAAFAGDGDYAPPFMPVGIYAGTADEEFWTRMQAVIRRYQDAGNPLLVETHRGAYRAAPVEVLTAQLDWMHLQMVFSHPKLTAADRAGSELWLGEERQRRLTISDPVARIEALAQLLALKGVQGSDTGRLLFQDWAADVVAQSAGQAEEGVRFWILQEANDQPWFSALDKDLRKDLGAKLRDLKKGEAGKRELAAFAAWQKAVEQADKANTDKKREAAAEVFAQVAEAYPDTRYGRLAAQRR